MHHADTGKGSETARRRFVESCSWSPNATQDAMVGLGLFQTAGRVATHWAGSVNHL